MKEWGMLGCMPCYPNLCKCVNKDGLKSLQAIMQSNEKLEYWSKLNNKWVDMLPSDSPEKLHKYGYHIRLKNENN